MRVLPALRALARRSMPAIFGIAALFSAACVAAVASHYAIDAIGDFAIPHDTYDHIGHVSRSIATLCAAGFAVFGAIVVIIAALSDARRFRGALRSVLGAHGLRSPLRLLTAIVPSTYAVLIAMESIDGRIATGLQPGLASALGGSIALGTSSAIAAAVIVALVLWRGLQMLCASERRIASAIGRLVARPIVQTDDTGCTVSTLAAPVTRGRESILARRAGKRAPPLPA